MCGENKTTQSNTGKNKARESSIGAEISSECYCCLMPHNVPPHLYVGKTKSIYEHVALFAPNSSC